MEKSIQRWVLPVGRFLLASLFILGAINKIIRYDSTLADMKAVGLEPAAVLLPMTILLEGVGGLILGFGVRGAMYAGGALAIFTLATNVYFHRFWELQGEMRALELSLFFKNISITGGLLLAASVSKGWSRA
jgi:putative oxidoreductase